MDAGSAAEVSGQLAPDVTVVIPVYNSGATLGRAVTSVLGQTLENIEVIIVDDGSTDDSLKIAADFAESDTRVSVMALPHNGGKARAMNRAAIAARGTWLAVLDADDRYLPDRLSILLAAGQEHGSDLVADNQFHKDHVSGLVVREAFGAQGAGREITLEDMIAHSDPGAEFDFGILKPMVRVAFLRNTQTEYHSEAKLAEDFYFMLELFLAGARGWLVHTPLYEWTLPFSPTARRWTSTGAGAWRYDYRQALETNNHFISKFGKSVRKDVARLLRTRAREYRVMVHYIDAQRLLADTGDIIKPAAIILRHPGTWLLLTRRVTRRLRRAVESGTRLRLLGH